MKVQVCSSDSYSTLILGTYDDVNKAISAAKDLVNDENVNNALTVDEKNAHWEFYFVELVDAKGEVFDDAFYSGKGSAGKHIATLIENGEILNLNDLAGVKVKIYLGKLDRKEWYATTPRKQPIDNINHEQLLDKTVYFLRKV